MQGTEWLGYMYTVFWQFQNDFTVDWNWGRIEQKSKADCAVL